MNRRTSILAPLALALAVPGAPDTQEPPFRAELRSAVAGGTFYADVWGEGNLALVAHIGQNFVDIVDVSDPDDATLLSTWQVPDPNTSASAQDVKAADGLMFVALDGGSPQSVEIVDLRDPLNPAHLSWVRIGGFTSPHNIFYDRGFLYLANGAGPEVVLVDLRAYDPDNPPTSITTPFRYVGNLGTVHDITVDGQRLYVADFSGSIKVFDVANIATQAATFLGEVRGGSVHSSWASGDRAYLVTADESFGGPARLFEMVDLGGSIELVQRDAWVNTLSGANPSGNPHNPLVSGNRVYLANNAGGVTALQIDRTSHTLELAASYDTSSIVPAAASGEGCWGVYPFFGDDVVLATDRQNGLFVVDFSGIELEFTAARPSVVPTGVGATIDVTIAELGSATLSAASPTLHASVNDGPVSTSALAPLGGNAWRATLPALDCGDRVDWWLSAEDANGVHYTRPGEAPDDVYSSFGSDGPVTVLFDDFEADLGWTVSSIGTTSGVWERGTPVDNGRQPYIDDPDSTGTRCFVTEIGTGGTTDDVDGGPTRLTSPVLDFGGFDGLISYRRWYFGDDSDGPQGEPFLVEVTNDAGASWTTVESVPRASGGWIEHTFRISDFVAPTSQVQVRFSAQDDPDNSTVEAGVDTFLARRFECALTLASATARNGTGLNRACYASVTAPVLGRVWTATVDPTGHPGATLTEIYLFAAPATGPVLSYGEVLVNLASPRFFRHSRPITQTPNVHANPIPYDVSFVGATTASQALVAGGGVELCNAVDLQVGF